LTPKIPRISVSCKQSQGDLWKNITVLPEYPRQRAAEAVSVVLKTAENLTKLDASLFSTNGRVEFDAFLHRIGSKLQWLSVRQSRHIISSQYLQSLPNLTFVLPKFFPNLFPECANCSVQLFGPARTINRSAWRAALDLF
jgi:hypothetical protein